MDKIFDLLKNNRIVQGALVVGGVAASAYYLYNGTKEVVEEEIAPSIEDRVREIICKADIKQYQQYQYYDINTLMSITEILAEYATPDFKEMCLRLRQERRKLMFTDQEKYFDSIYEYCYEIVMVLGKQSSKLQKIPEYNHECMQASISIFARDPQYAQQLVYSLAQVKSSIANPNVKLTKDDAHSVLEFYISYLKTQPAIMVHLIKYMAQKVDQENFVYNALKIAMYDQLFIDRGIEEEDFLVIGMSEEYQSDPKTQTLQQQYGQAVSAFVQYHFE